MPSRASYAVRFTRLILFVGVVLLRILTLSSVVPKGRQTSVTGLSGSVKLPDKTRWSPTQRKVSSTLMTLLKLIAACGADRQAVLRSHPEELANSFQRDEQGLHYPCLSGRITLTTFHTPHSEIRIFKGIAHDRSVTTEDENGREFFLTAKPPRPQRVFAFFASWRFISGGEE
ncbi:MAG: hypothetical protein AUJ92_17370 [Armatimonadetes bacterium CG2_30_59_28]|nr:hypothetical protein [Armatimonadota bacterium]OIO91034.1 MAG: hypothetical protein AUJ92_17370 [Armatimonadetes bacterium CG2_30_59_28]PIU63163.1 MAG: hypothetical protein COS85_16540 [Armatimonadetes bacterium CG07_land_8_20_14_0_80_59_28]PIX42309.1 MAG: hypothetical protein COZ56_09700 [Armatimonadetes bacterium CG_4_8_14_3_um_filter_58_9]PJB76042.1 MAG: hypothetical protein CO095_02995 [Armatimonadetes bacterium CG_4_9_14_3_um_filter_58_7]